MQALEKEPWHPLLLRNYVRFLMEVREYRWKFDLCVGRGRVKGVGAVGMEVAVDSCTHCRVSVSGIPFPCRFICPHLVISQCWPGSAVLCCLSASGTDALAAPPSPCPPLLVGAAG